MERNHNPASIKTLTMLLNSFFFSFFFPFPPLITSFWLPDLGSSSPGYFLLDFSIDVWDAGCRTPVFHSQMPVQQYLMMRYQIKIMCDIGIKILHLEKLKSSFNFPLRLCYCNRTAFQSSIKAIKFYSKEPPKTTKFYNLDYWRQTPE